MWLVTTNSFPGYWGSGKSLPEAVANARKSGGKAPWVARRLSEGWVEPHTDGLNVYATYEGDDMASAPPMVAERFLVSQSGVIKEH
jgi:hypothetical protein